MGVSACSDEIYTVPESWTGKAYPTLVHYNRLLPGGEMPALRKRPAAKRTTASDLSTRCGEISAGKPKVAFARQF